MVTKIILLNLLLLGSLSANVLTDSHKKLFKSNRCKNKVSDQLNSWKGLGDWTKHYAGEKTVKLITPTRNFAKWIEVYFGERNNEMRLITPTQVMTVKFDTKCEKTITVQNAPKAIKEKNHILTDKKLFKILKEKKNGLIYAWGPQMPLSIDGITEIRKSATKANLDLILVLPSERDIKPAKMMLKKRNVKVDEIVVSNSMELSLRGSFLHLPSVVSFKNSKLERRARPGYEKSRLWDKYIQDRMGK